MSIPFEVSQEAQRDAETIVRLARNAYGMDGVKVLIDIKDTLLKFYLKGQEDKK